MVTGTGRNAGIFCERPPKVSSEWGHGEASKAEEPDPILGAKEVCLRSSSTVYEEKYNQARWPTPTPA